MDMSRHDTEVCKVEAIFVFGVLQGHQHDFPAKPVLEDPDSVICSGSNMISGPIGEFSFFSHIFPLTYIWRESVKMLCLTLKKNEIFEALRYMLGCFYNGTMRFW